MLVRYAHHHLFIYGRVTCGVFIRFIQVEFVVISIYLPLLQLLVWFMLKHFVVSV